MENQMCFASAMTTEQDVARAADHLVSQIEAQLAGRIPDLVLMFLSPHYRLEVAGLVARLQSRLKPPVLLGCTAEGVIGREQEIEREPAITLVAAHLPGVELNPFALQSMDWRRTLSEAAELRGMVNAPPETKLFLLLADPYTTPMDAVLEAFNLYYPAMPIIGGMASGSQRAGGNALIYNDQVLNNGAVGLTLAGAFEADIIVSQAAGRWVNPLPSPAPARTLFLVWPGSRRSVRFKPWFKPCPRLIGCCCKMVSLLAGP
ncbi:MAG: hypothetical protein HC875_22090 [Anaerolineales bacterium]|nr:hypothetical protein [Anaerolineales bacterium]